MERWTKEQEKYLIENYLNTNYKTLANILNKSEGAIRAKCFDLKLIKNNRWSEEEILYLKNNYQRLTTKEIAKYLNRTETSIHLKSKKLGLKKYPYTCKYDFFKNIDTEEKAYWLGFIYADGWISVNDKTNSGHVGIQLQINDDNHLKKFNKDICGNYPITYGESACNISKDSSKLYSYCLLRIFSIDMINDLKYHGVSNDKTYNMIMPVISNDLIRHFVRGYFDGDGCVRTRTRKLSNGEIKQYPMCDFTCHDLNFLEKLRSILFEYKIHSYIYPENGHYRLCVNGMSENITFLNWIYKDSVVYLERKYKRYLEIKNYMSDNCLAS